MHIETLRTFCDLVESGSFREAARLNFVSQSAVSQQVKALERRYGRVLLERGGRRGVVPTEAGRVFHAECRELLDRFRRLEERLKTPSGAVAGVVRIATVYSIGLHGLPPYVARFVRTHPQVKVDVEYVRTDKVCDACLAGTIDFGIVALPVRRANLTLVPWRRETLVLVCPPGHPLARRRKVRVSDLTRERFIAFEKDIPTRKTIDSFLKAHRATVKPVMQLDNIETIKRSVEVGIGVSILPDATVATEVAGGVLSTAGFVEGPFSRETGIVYGRRRQLSPAAQAFIRLLGAGPTASATRQPSTTAASVVSSRNVNVSRK
jgi:DNA-binding transcriptional LysR family regulator